MPESSTNFPIVRRVPTCPENHRESIAAFLQHFRDHIERSLNDHRVAAMQNPTPSICGQITYQRSQLATINWLIAMNSSRRKAGVDNAN